jgi:putative oxidoreductase
MSLLSAVARPMLGGIFIYGGLDSIRRPQSKVPAAQKVVGDVSELLGDDVDPTQLVRINGAVQVGAGAALALGLLPRVAAVALAASLVPTTAAGHRFWEEEDATTRAQQTIHFLKNLAILGGLLFAAADTGGRPSLSWRARRAVSGAAQHALDIVPGAHA